MLFSIITPIYNAGNFLEKCINSILNQTYTNWELLLINDGSTDNSWHIAQVFSKIDDRIHCYTHDNAGVSKTRNRGIELAQGDYVLFVDADDEISPETLESLRDSIEKTNCDIVVYNAYRTDVDSKVTSKLTIPFSNEELLLKGEKDKKEYIYSALASDKIFGIIGIFSVKRDLLTDIRFPVNTTVCEDLIFDIKMYEKAEKILCLPNYFYFYRNNPSGCVNNFNYKKIHDLKIAFEQKMNLIKKYDLEKNIPAVVSFFSMAVIGFYYTILNDKKLCDEFRNHILNDKFILGVFDQVQFYNLSNVHTHSKILFGTIIHRKFLRTRILLKRKLRALILNLKQTSALRK